VRRTVQRPSTSTNSHAFCGFKLGVNCFRNLENTFRFSKIIAIFDSLPAFSVSILLRVQLQIDFVGELWRLRSEALKRRKLSVNHCAKKISKRSTDLDHRLPLKPGHDPADPLQSRNYRWRRDTTGDRSDSGKCRLENVQSLSPSHGCNSWQDRADRTPGLLHRETTGCKARVAVEFRMSGTQWRIGLFGVER
jgi:hypothetical protein